MITLTFEPTCPEQAALLGKFLPEYMKLGALVVTGEPDTVKAVVDTAAEIVDTEKPVAKKPRAAKPAAAAETPTPDSLAGAGTPASTATSASPSEPAITLEQVRAKLAALSQAGKAADVKALLGDFGVAKLTDVPVEKYAELMAKAEAI